MPWNPQITAAYARGRGQFCIALAELSYDELFTAVIEYDDRFPQPWSRTDIEREITAIAPPDRLSGTSDRYALLSNEGDFYLTGSDGLREKFPGSGLLSPDATGDGAMFGLSLVDGVLWAVGAGGQVYRREGPDRWAKIAAALAQPQGFEKPRFGAITGSSIRDIYIGGLATPRAAQPERSVVNRLMTNDSWDDWNDAYETAKKSSPAAGLKTEGRALHWDGERWFAIAIPGDPPSTIRDIFVEEPRTVWLVGTAGLMLKGNTADGFVKQGFAGDTQTLLSMTRFHGRYILASDYSLHVFDGHLLTPLKPVLRRKSQPTPFKIQAVDDVMFYFDYKQGVHRWDGETWEEIVIPPELLEREFKGLPPRG